MLFAKRYRSGNGCTVLSLDRRALRQTAFFFGLNDLTDEINVIVFDRGQKHLYLRYIDPVTGQKIETSAGTSNKRVAIKRAGKWQSEVNAGGAVSARVVRGDDFREDFLASDIRPQSVNYCIAVESTFSIVEDIMKPDRITRCTTNWLKRFKTAVIKQEKSPATVHNYLQHLKATKTRSEETLDQNTPADIYFARKKLQPPIGLEPMT